MGAALLKSRPELFLGAQATWGSGNHADRPTREMEHALERAVSDYIGAMPFLWLPIDDAASKGSERAHIEATCIALLSNAGKPAIDPPSRGWLGRSAAAQAIRESGLWNVNHVYRVPDPEGLDLLEARVGSQWGDG